MANVKLDNNVYQGVNKVKLPDSTTEGSYVEYSVGGGSAVKKVLYANGNDISKMLQDDGGQAWINLFPNHIAITMINEIYTQQETATSNSVLSPLPSTVYLYNYNVSGNQKIDPSLLAESNKIGIARLSSSMSQFISYDDVTLQDTGVTVNIGGYTFHEAIIVEGE